MKNPYQAYQKATHTVSKTRQVVMLYQGVLRNLQQAKEAIEQKDVMLRYNKLVRASEIVIGLQMSLDFDSGRESAQALYDFYSQIDSRIMQLHRSQSAQECDALIEDVRRMHDVWDNIDRGQVDGVAAATPDARQEASSPSAEQSAEAAAAPADQPVTFSA